MSQRPTGEVNLGRKLLLAALGVCVAGPSVFALVIATRVCAQSAQTTSAPSPSFEAAFPPCRWISREAAGTR